MNTEYTLQEKYNLIKQALLQEKGTNPTEIAKRVMRKQFVNMHGPEHHFLDGGALMTAIFNAGLPFDLSACLDKLAERSAKMPGAMCGYWGVCGSVASVGAVLSVIHEVGPLSDNDYYSDGMKYTSSVIAKMSEIGGPRCCKRNAFLSLGTAAEFVEQKYGVKLETEQTVCEFFAQNKQCIKQRCPFYPKKLSEKSNT
ncbi:MAG: DUF5714 domain-containing protein [Candidatus Fimimonas sp.]